MPTSDAWGKPAVKDVVAKIHAIRPIDSMVDVGAGEGTYAMLLRDVLPHAWMVAIEAWGPYVTEYDLTSKYNKVYVSDVSVVDWALFSAADLFIFGDVIEHLPKVAAKRVIRTAMKSVANHESVMIIAIPVLHLDQGALDGNWFEVHRPEKHWSDEEMYAFLNQAAGEYVSVDRLVGDVVAYYFVTTGEAADIMEGINLEQYGKVVE